jgi:hypothetical protein
MKKKVYLIPLAVGLLLLFAGCPSDADESGVTNGNDFSDYKVTHDRVNAISDVYFYDNYNGKEFFYYFDTDADGDADYLIRCGSGVCDIEKEVPGSPGLFEKTGTGTCTTSGQKYHVEFPLSALNLQPNSEWAVNYWFYEITEQDRMPDTGYGVLANIL